MDLIQTLNRFRHLTPDQIVERIGDPFSVWMKGRDLTREQYEIHNEVEIVLLNEGAYGTPEQAEVGHRIGFTTAGDRWHYVSHWQDWLGRDFWMRSRKSYEANPYEPAPAP